MVAALLLPSARDPSAFACQEDRVWGRKKESFLKLTVRYFLGSFALRTADLHSFGYISAC